MGWIYPIKHSLEAGHTELEVQHRISSVMEKYSHDWEGLKAVVSDMISTQRNEFFRVSLSEQAPHSSHEIL